MKRLRKKITHHLNDLVQVESFYLEDATTAIFAAGITSRAAKAAVKTARKSGKRLGLLRPLTIWPFPDIAVRKYLSNKKAIIVPELNQGQLSLELRKALGGAWSIDNRKSKKIIEIHKNNGELITPDEILNAMKEAK